jgi:branched-chain amino acid transport system ATP-binding protein
MLTIGRALLTNPRLLLMDEPSEGLAPALVEELLETCTRLLAEGIGLLVVEQNLGVAARLADRLLVMVSGRIEHETPAAALLADEDAQRRYLGVEVL